MTLKFNLINIFENKGFFLMGNIEDLEKILELKNKGILTQEEFETEKKKILKQQDNINTDEDSKIFENRLEGKKIVIVLGVVISITIITLIIIFNKNTENDNTIENVTQNIVNNSSINSVRVPIKDTPTDKEVISCFWGCFWDTFPKQLDLI